MVNIGIAGRTSWPAGGDPDLYVLHKQPARRPGDRRGPIGDVGGLYPHLL